MRRFRRRSPPGVTLDSAPSAGRYRTVTIAGGLAGLSGASLYAALDAELRRAGAEELVVSTAGGQPEGFSRAGMLHGLPGVPPEELLLQLRQGRPFVSL